MPDLVIQIVDTTLGIVEHEVTITERELKVAHEQQRCDAGCGYCYQEGCEWLAKQKSEK